MPGVRSSLRATTLTGSTEAQSCWRDVCVGGLEIGPYVSALD